MKVWALVVIVAVLAVASATETATFNAVFKETTTAAKETATTAATTTTAAAATTKVEAKKVEAKKVAVKKAAAKKAATTAAAKTTTTAKAAAKTTTTAKAAAKVNAPPAPVAPAAPAVPAPLQFNNAKKTPGALCSAFAKSCAVCTDVHNCAWTKQKTCVEIGSEAYDAARKTNSVFDACPKVVVVDGKRHVIPQTKRPLDIVEPAVGASNDPQPVIATADVVIKLPPGVAVTRPGNFSLIQQKAAKKDTQPQGYLTPEFN